MLIDNVSACGVSIVNRKDNRRTLPGDGIVSVCLFGCCRYPTGDPLILQRMLFAQFIAPVESVNV